MGTLKCDGANAPPRGLRLLLAKGSSGAWAGEDRVFPSWKRSVGGWEGWGRWWLVALPYRASGVQKSRETRPL